MQIYSLFHRLPFHLLIVSFDVHKFGTLKDGQKNVPPQVVFRSGVPLISETQGSKPVSATYQVGAWGKLLAKFPECRFFPCENEDLIIFSSQSLRNGGG